MIVGVRLKRFPRWVRVTCQQRRCYFVTRRQRFDIVCCCGAREVVEVRATLPP